MGPENLLGSARGLNRVEVWLFVVISVLGLLGFMSTLSTSDVRGLPSSEESKAAIYAQQALEDLVKRQPFTAGPESGRLSGLEPGYTGSFRVTPIASSPAPNRRTRIIVTVKWGAADLPPEAVTLETTRAE